MPLFGGTIYSDGQFAVGCMTGNLVVNGAGQIMGLTSGAVEGARIPSTTQPPLLSPGSRVGTSFPLQLTGTPGVNYVIQAGNQPGFPSWTALVTNSPISGTLDFTDTTATVPIRFYRVALP